MIALHLLTVLVDQPVELVQGPGPRLRPGKVRRVDEKRLNRVQPVAVIKLFGRLTFLIVLKILLTVVLESTSP